MPLEPLPFFLIKQVVEQALQEDLGHNGDITSRFVIPETTQAEGMIIAHEAGCIAGMDLASTCFRTYHSHLHITCMVQEGDYVEAGHVIMKISGFARAILSAERVALNFLGHLSGIATQTNLLVQAVKMTQAKITSTRKTTPTLRMLEKYAVRAGGGNNHRCGLSDGILIKDNHIALAGSLTKALQSASDQAGHMTPIEIEVDTLKQLEETLNIGATIILLDNMSPETLTQAIQMIDGRAITEASGNIKLETIRPIAQTGVDYISVGYITHSAPCLDVGLDFQIT